MPITTTVPPSLRANHTQALQIIARSLFRELQANGYTPHHVITLSSELIQLVTDELKNPPSEPGPQR